MAIIRRSLLLLLVGVMSGCSSLSGIHDRGDAEKNKSMQSIEVLDVRKKTNLVSILPDLLQKQVVLVGESHTSYADHQNQLAVIKALFPHWPKMGIGVEFIQSPYQNVLDDYVSGDLSDAQMLKKTQWYQRWRYDFRLYRDIFHYAKTNKIPLIALNTPTELIKKISKNGISGLNAQDRGLLPTKIKASKTYRERLLKVFRQHAPASSKGLNHFIDVQLAWDESMAANAAKAIRSGKVNQMVLLAGSGHVIRQAIPARLSLSTAIIVNDLPEDLSEVDYLLHIQSGSDQELPSAGKIGIMMESVKQTVVVASVLKSHKADLKKGDMIISIDGKKVISPEDIKIALLDKKPGESIRMKIQRKNQPVIQKHVKLM